MFSDVGLTVVPESPLFPQENNRKQTANAKINFINNVYNGDGVV
jgi:hypothetical protein